MHYRFPGRFRRQAYDGGNGEAQDNTGYGGTSDQTNRRGGATSVAQVFFQATNVLTCTTVNQCLYGPAPLNQGNGDGGYGGGNGGYDPNEVRRREMEREMRSLNCPPAMDGVNNEMRQITFNMQQFTQRINIALSYLSIFPEWAWGELNNVQREMQPIQRREEQLMRCLEMIPRIP